MKTFASVVNSVIDDTLSKPSQISISSSMSFTFVWQSQIRYCISVKRLINTAFRTGLLEGLVISCLVSGSRRLVMWHAQCIDYTWWKIKNSPDISRMTNSSCRVSRTAR